MKLIRILLLLLVPFLGFGQMKKSVFTYGATGKYLKYSPIHLKPVGIILYLHGLGERGSDLSLLERNEIPKLFKQGKEVPYIVLAPQLAADKKAWGTNELVVMFNIMDTYEGLEKHITGLSLGGIGTYAGVLKAKEYFGKPGYFKTAVSVCGRTTTTDVEAFRNTSIKMYHGTSDTTVPIGSDYALLKLLQTNNIDVQGKFYFGLGHNIWGMAYNEDEASYWEYLKSKTVYQEIPKSDTVNLGIYIESTSPYKLETYEVK